MWPFDRWFPARAEPTGERIFGRIDLTEWQGGSPAHQSWYGEQVTAQGLVRLHVWAANGDFGDCRFTLSDRRDEALIISLLCGNAGCREGRISDPQVQSRKAYHPQARVFVQRGDFPGYCFVLVATDPAQP